MSKSEKTAFPRSPCPVACMLDIVGDKWTLLVVRDLLLGASRYGDFLNSPEHIPTNILANRLKLLVEQGLVEKRAYQQNPLRHEYRLTPKGRDLKGLLKEMVRWGNKHVPGTIVPAER